MTESTAGTSRLKVLLTTEGTYPHYTGGVSTWCDRLIDGLDDTDFVVWSLMMNPFIKEQFVLPDNVVRFVGVPLWGVEQPAEYTREISSGRVFESSRRTKERDIERHFLPLFETFLDQTMAALFQPEIFAGVLADMHEYFKHWEYRTTWRSRAVWDSFKQRLLADAGYEWERIPVQDERDASLLPSISDLTGSVRTLFSMKTGASRQIEPHHGGEEGDEVPLFGEAIEGLRWLYRLLQALNVEVPQADITHSAAAAFCAIPCILSKVQHGTPFLLTEHGVYLREQYLNIERGKYPFNLKRFLIDLVSAVSQTAFALADQVSPVCQFNARWETAYGTPQERIRVIYNGVSPEAYRPMDVPRRPDPTVVQVSRIDPLKDQLTLLRVADLVRQQIPNVQFHQHGPVNDDEYFQDVKDLHKQLNLEGTVHFLGETDKVAEAYAAGDLAIMTSISEAFPFGAVEPLMCGKPVVATAVGGVKEALDGTGLTAPARDPEALAAAVVTMLSATPEERADLSVRARQRAIDHFTLQQFIDAYRESYSDLAALGQQRAQLDVTDVVEPDAFVLPPSYEEAIADDEPIEVVPTVVGEEFPSEPVISSMPGGPFDQPVDPVTTSYEVDPTYDQPDPRFEEEAPAPVEARPLDEEGAADPLSYEGLIAALASDEPFERMRAIAAVAPAPGVEEALMSALEDPYAPVRRETVRALARVGGLRVIGALLATAESDPSAEVRRAAIEALGPLLTTTENNHHEDSGAGA